MIYASVIRSLLFLLTNEEKAGVAPPSFVEWPSMGRGLYFPRENGWQPSGWG
jgi:hypothetical protein